MRPRTLIYLLLGALFAVFLLANLRLLTVPLELNLLAGQVRAPLGVFLLVIAGLVFLVDLAAHTLARRSWGQDRRSLDRQIEELRIRADDRESARLVQLQATLERELAGIRAQLDRLVGDSRPSAAPSPAPPPAALPPMRASRFDTPDVGAGQRGDRQSL